MTTRDPAFHIFTAVAAVVAWSAVVLQFALSLQLAVANGKGIIGGVVIYFGFFTILTNILVALALSIPRVAPASALGRLCARPGVATTVAAAIVVVAVAYHFLLRNMWAPEGWQLVADVALHYVTPVLFLVYWLRAVPKEELTWMVIPTSTVYPLGYTAYVFLRGALTGLYPYPFIDVSTLGFGAALTNAGGVLLGFVLVVAMLVAGGRLAARTGPAAGRVDGAA